MLGALTELRGISGYEHDVHTFITEQIEPHCDTLTTDSLGNLYAHQDGDGSHVCLLAHMDEVGLMVTGSDEKNGWLTFDTVGGIRDSLLPGTTVRVGPHGHAGVIGLPAVHLQSSADRKKPLPKEKLRIDVGEAHPSIEIGDMVTFDTPFLRRDDTIYGKAFDDRIGCYCLIELLQERLGVPLTCVFTVQEEVGLRGASVVRSRIECDYAIACEGTFALDHPSLSEEERMPRMGHGPAVTIADRTLITHATVLEAIGRAADENDIPYQYKRPLAGGTDAGAFHVGGRGTPSGVIAAPCRYIHSPCAMAKWNDVIHMKELIGATARYLAEGV
jgi:endoglucanase